MIESSEPGAVSGRRLPRWVVVLAAVIAIVAIGTWLVENVPLQTELQTISCPVHGPYETPWPNVPAVCRW